MQEREAILEKVATAIEANEDRILAENEADVNAAEGKIDAHLMNRLRLKPQKIQQLAKGIRAIAAQDEPLRKACRLCWAAPELAAGSAMLHARLQLHVLLDRMAAQPAVLGELGQGGLAPHLWQPLLARLVLA